MIGISTYLSIITPFIYLMLIMGGVVAFKLVLESLKFRKSTYSDISGNTFWKTYFDKGNYGEFLTYRILEKLQGNHKVLTNVYLPKKDGTTTEIDLIMIDQTGLYVFESKNYSGWIFGDEKSKMWTQSLKGGKKVKFYNPISQNKGHIKALDQFWDKKYSQYIHSLIIFSERCELKKITVTSTNVSIINRYKLLKVITKALEVNQKVLDEHEIEKIYHMLKQCTLVDQATKLKHIEGIKANSAKY